MAGLDFAHAIQALRDGEDSVLYDGTTYPDEGHIRKTMADILGFEVDVIQESPDDERGITVPVFAHSFLNQYSGEYVFRISKCVESATSTQAAV